MANEDSFKWIGNPNLIIIFLSFSGHGFDKEGYDTLIEAQYKAVTEMQPSEYQYMSAHLDCNKVCNFFHPCYMAILVVEFQAQGYKHKYFYPEKWTDSK